MSQNKRTVRGFAVQGYLPDPARASHYYNENRLEELRISVTGQMRVHGITYKISSGVILENWGEPANRAAAQWQARTADTYIRREGTDKTSPPPPTPKAREAIYAELRAIGEDHCGSALLRAWARFEAYTAHAARADEAVEDARQALAEREVEQRAASRDLVYASKVLGELRRAAEPECPVCGAPFVALSGGATGCPVHGIRSPA